MSASSDLEKWVKARRVLCGRLATIAREQGKPGNRDELKCALVDLLNPQRGRRQEQMLKAMGIPFEDANGMWEKLSSTGRNWENRLDWEKFGQAIQR